MSNKLRGPGRPEKPWKMQRVSKDVIEHAEKRGNRRDVIENAYWRVHMKDEIKTLLEKQKIELSEQDLTEDQIKEYVFQEDDLVERFLNEKGIKEDSVNLEELRDLQHGIVNELV